jgi:hypothetical protein
VAMKELADGVLQRRPAPTAKSDRCRCRRGRASEYTHRRLVTSADFVKVPPSSTMLHRGAYLAVTTRA